MSSIAKIKAELDRIQRENKALVVLCITPTDGVVSVLPEMRPEEVAEMLRNEIPSIEAFLQRKAAR
jgi:hypothetical protein